MKQTNNYINRGKKCNLKSALSQCDTVDYVPCNDRSLRSKALPRRFGDAVMRELSGQTFELQRATYRDQMNILGSFRDSAIKSCYVNHYVKNI